MSKKKKLLMFVLCTFVLTLSFGLTCFASGSEVELPFNTIPDMGPDYTTYVITKENDSTYWVHYFGLEGGILTYRSESKGLYVQRASKVISAKKARLVLEGNKWVCNYVFTNDDYNSCSTKGTIVANNVPIYDYQYTNRVVFEKKTFKSSLTQITALELENLGQQVAKSQKEIVTTALLILSSMVSVVLLIRFGKRWFH